MMSAVVMKFLKTWGLMLSFAIGLAYPALHVFSGCIPVMVGSMLLITFLGMDARGLRPQRRHAWIIAFNVFLGLAPWAILRALGCMEYAEAGFFAGIAGEAASAPVIVKMLDGKAEFVATGLVLNSLASVLIIPLLAPFVVMTGAAEIERADIFLAVLQQMASMLLLPCAAACLLRRFHPDSRKWSEKLSGVSLVIWLCCMSVVAGTGVTRVMDSGASLAQLLPYGLSSLIVCIAGFGIGRFIGGRHLGLECAQCLGQKNATVTIYLALCYSAPLVFLGPALYLFFHHIYNTFQMVRHQRSLSHGGASHKA